MFQQEAVGIFLNIKKAESLGWAVWA